MSPIFTLYVRSLEPGTSSDPQQFAAMWEALRQALLRELRRRGLFAVSPACLGIYGAKSWFEADALNELLADCYIFIFIKRLRRLKAQLEIKQNIEGLVFRNIRNFLYDVQKKHDPIGFRIFEMLQKAIQSCLDFGVLAVVEGREKINNDTYISFSSRKRDARGENATVSDLKNIAIAWNNHLLPDLVTARGREVPAIQTRLEQYLQTLPEEGITTFRFRDLVDAIKHDVQARWQAVWTVSQGSTAVVGDPAFPDLVKLVEPKLDYEERQSFDRLLLQVESEIENLKLRRKTRLYLGKLWIFLKNHALGTLGGSASGKPRAGSLLPSQRQLSRLLGIPREQINPLFGTLRSIVDRVLDNE